MGKCHEVTKGVIQYVRILDLSWTLPVPRLGQNLFSGHNKIPRHGWGIQVDFTSIAL